VARRWPANAALAAGSLAAALAVAEVALRWLDFAPDYWDWNRTLLALDPEVLYRIEGHSRRDVNALGYRDYEFPREKRGLRRILVLGDSFVFGDNVARSETLPKQLERLLAGSGEVFNMGVPGDGPDQSLARLRRDGLDLAPDDVVLALYPGNDFNDVLKNELFLLDERGELVFNRANPVARALPWLRTAVLARKALSGRGLDPEVEARLNAVLGGDAFDLLADPASPPDSQKIGLVRGALRAFDRELRSAGARFHVAIIPTVHAVQHDGLFRRKGIPPEQYFRNEQVAERLCEEEGLSHLNLQYPFLAHRSEPLYDLRDGHLSARGNALAAEALAMLLGDASARP
jgi:hypothetical protein